FHGLLAYRQDFKVRVGTEKMPAIEWVATMEPQFDRQPLLLKTQHGAKFHPFTRPYAFEGHPSQTLALMSESKLPLDYKFKIGNETVTISDFLNSTMMEVNPREEITWVLWALINYVKVDTQWVNQWGQAWSIESLVQHQVRARVEGGPCGGNHGLFVLVRARDKYLADGRPLRGVWLEADQKIQRYVQIARSLQNQDGSFSSEFYEGRGHSRDMNERFNTTGHTFEFLSIGLTNAQLNEPWVRSAATVLANELYQHRRAQPDCGPLYHSLNALMNYRDRLRPPQPAVAVTTPTVAPAPTITTPSPTPSTTDSVAPADALRPANVPHPSATALPGVAPAVPTVSAPALPVVAPKTPVITGPTASPSTPVVTKTPTPAVKPAPAPVMPLKLPPSLEAKLMKIGTPAPVAPTVASPTTEADASAPRLPVVTPTSQQSP
ncbi:MAG TPA: hypothetical protein VFG20_18235, partial [Planctomycetaceae bacterium]|nr:hypothetical protein [Planctomycetaceae bacterium]